MRLQQQSTAYYDNVLRNLCEITSINTIYSQAHQVLQLYMKIPAFSFGAKNNSQQSTTASSTIVTLSASGDFEIFLK